MASVLTIEEKIKGRHIFNEVLLDNLAEYLKKFPDMRFGQALINLGYAADDTKMWYEESADTFSRTTKSETIL